MRAGLTEAVQLMRPPHPAMMIRTPHDPDSHAPSLTERYTATDGTVFLTGIQALVRLALDQQRRDRAEGRTTAAFISGYEGSPLGGLDIELGRRADLLRELSIDHEPALNEELAATAVWGTQLVPTRPDSRVDGVVGYWYGKAPGLDRASDALRHANFSGAHPHGGALALVGDDPTAKSSTVTSGSELALADLGMPTFYPADCADILELGRHAIAMSRASGLWSAMKMVTNVADGSGTVELQRLPAPLMPQLDDGRGEPFQHRVSAALMTDVSRDAEVTAFGIRLDTAREYARLNHLNRIESHGAGDRVGIVAAGKTYLDLCQALSMLGLDADGRARHGIRLLKLELVFPLEPTQIAEFCEGLDEIIVVEEKRPFIESALKEELYGRAGAPRISGKRDPDGQLLIANAGELDPDSVADAIAKRLVADDEMPSVRDWVARRALRVVRVGESPSLQAATVARTPYFCSGCPHNRSTVVPDGSVVGAGIGCHTLAMVLAPDRVGDVIGLTQMGGEGAQWLGMTPFLATEHLLQNMGDGTFHHSGSQAIRAAVAARANITFKILYNSAVAMTGGQQPVGLRSVAQLTQLLDAEGVARIIVTTEEPNRYRRVRLHGAAKVWHRDRLDEAQRVLSATPGVTVLIHDQQCATEKRRSLKRDPPTRPNKRVVINERACEGCGDCGRKSNCLSVEPVETEYGRKTQIHQGSCNFDYSCLQGDCPSFLVVTPDKRGRRPAAPPGGPEGPPALDAFVVADDFNVRVVGIGGTGIVTVAQILANAAHLAGRHVRALDQTGLAQKGGPVLSDIKISQTPIARAHKCAEAECDLYLGCDVLVAADSANLAVNDPERTVAVVSTAHVPTGPMVADWTLAFPDDDLLDARIDASCRSDASVYLDARVLAHESFGSDQSANLVLLGAAYQAGAIPLPLAALEGSIRLNGVAVEQNLAAFALGRQTVAARASGAAAQDAGLEARGAQAEAETGDGGEDLAVTVRLRQADLVAYQSEAYAEGYARVVERVLAVSRERGAPDDSLAIAVARNLYKLMAYKDEYEIARLCLDPAVGERIAAEFGPKAHYSWMLQPPLLRMLGLRRKIAVGRWARPLFVALRAGRRLRGTPLDAFGFTRVRRLERQLLTEYRDVIDECLLRLDVSNYELATAIAELPDLIRGYEEIKLASVERYAERMRELRAQYAGAAPPASSAAALRR